jgi:hypothetical protein
MLETPEIVEQNNPIETPVKAPLVDFDYVAEAQAFLGHSEFVELVGSDEIEKIIAEVNQIEINDNLAQHEVVYDKRKNTFTVNNELVTAGEVVASRHQGTRIKFSDSIDSGFMGKKLKETYLKSLVRDAFTTKLNKILAEKLAITEAKKDALKSKAYSEIANREGERSEQLGVIAESMMTGVAEMIAINRPDLHIVVERANAYQDVHEKIDFIIKTKTKKRGVGTEAGDIGFDEKNFGIQFTVNTEKAGHKMDQINKSKARELDVDDILLVMIDSTTLSKAINNWKSDGKKIRGPFSYLPKTTQKATIEKLFKNILNTEEEASLIKNFE